MENNGFMQLKVKTTNDKDILLGKRERERKKNVSFMSA